MPTRRALPDPLRELKQNLGEDCTVSANGSTTHRTLLSHGFTLKRGTHLLRENVRKKIGSEMHWRFYRTAVTTSSGQHKERGCVQVSREAPWEDWGEQKLLSPATFTPRGVGGKSSYRQGCRGRLVAFVINAETPAAHVNRTSRAPSRFKLQAAVPRHHALSDSVTSSPIQSLSPSCYQDERVPQRWKPATAAEAFGRCPNL